MSNESEYHCGANRRKQERSSNSISGSLTEPLGRLRLNRGFQNVDIQHSPKMLIRSRIHRSVNAVSDSLLSPKIGSTLMNTPSETPTVQHNADRQAVGKLIVA